MKKSYVVLGSLLSVLVILLYVPLGGGNSTIVTLSKAQQVKQEEENRIYTAQTTCINAAKSVANYDFNYDPTSIRTMQYSIIFAAKYQNGFGAWQNKRIFCEMNNKQKVIDFKFI